MTRRVRAFPALIRAKPDNHGWEIYMANQFKGFASYHLRAGFPHLRSQLSTPWSQCSFVAMVGAASADTVQRYIETQYERPSKAGGRA